MRIAVAALLVFAALALFPMPLLKGQFEDPVYVGARICARCHDGPGQNHQFSKWLLSKHARAYAALSAPEASEIAELSGVPGEPQRAMLCLGCHATAADSEEWEKDEGFLIEDGVQCEKCHGPGSEYISVDVMLDREAALRAGLRIPRRQDCLVCHHEKGSHTRVLGTPKWEVSEAWEQIEHASPDQPEHTEDIISVHAISSSDGPKYAGVHACVPCHEGVAQGSQFSRWKLSAHSNAYALLSTPKAYEIARAEGLRGTPQRSGVCLSCHSTISTATGDALPSFSIDEGVGCEACHGPGSNHISQKGEGWNSKDGGMIQISREMCLRCHSGEHAGDLNYEESLKLVQHPVTTFTPTQKPIYKTPLNLAISPDSKELYVTCEGSYSVIVVDVNRRSKLAEIEVGGQPHDVAFSPDGDRAFVTNRLDDTVSVIDVRTRRVVQTVPVGDEPHGLLLDPLGTTLFVLNTAEGTISVLDSSTLSEVKRLSGGTAPWSLSISPEGDRLLVTNALSQPVEFRHPPRSEVTVMRLGEAIVEDRLTVPGSNLLQGVAWHPEGGFAFFTLTRTKNLVPMTRLSQGWTVSNGIGIAWKDGTVDQVLLDEPNLAFPDPTDVAFTPDGRFSFVTSSGSNRVAVVDVSRLTALLREASEHEREEVLPNHLGNPTEFVIKHIQTHDSPRGILVTPDGTTAFVANALDDSLTIIDVASLEVSGTIDLGGPQEITEVRLGERLFHSANITFHRQFSCHTCHPDGHVDGITFDIEADGVGVSPVDNRSLRGILDTAPFKWEGTNPNLQRQCGPRLAVFFTRIQPFTPEQLTALENYIARIPRPPNRYRPLGSPLTPAQRRGKQLFERTKTNDGRPIPVDRRCITCHPAPLYTNHQRVDVGTKMQYDRESLFDVPHLNNIYASAPYLHNGIAQTLEEIWTVYNPEDKHSITNDLTKDQLNDLIEYIKTF